MPIVKISQGDIDKTKPPAAGWHVFEVEDFTERPTKDKQSTNWSFECRIVSSNVGSENIGRYGYPGQGGFSGFNSKQPGRLVSSGFLPALYGMNETEFMNGKKELELNFDELKGKQFYGLIKDDVYEGKIQKRLEEFASTAKPPF